jgi:hypothetical protein
VLQAWADIGFDCPVQGKAKQYNQILVRFAKAVAARDGKLNLEKRTLQSSAVQLPV